MGALRLSQGERLGLEVFTKVKRMAIAFQRLLNCCRSAIDRHGGSGRGLSRTAVPFLAEIPILQAV